MRHAALFVVVLLVLVGGMFVLGPQGTAAQNTVLQAQGELQWYRGNMHTHSYWSDGDNFLEMIAHWYEQNDYDFLVFTDHNVLADRERWVDVAKIKQGEKAFLKLKEAFPDWVEQREVDDRTEVRLRTFSEVSERFNKPGEYLLIQGEEITDHYHRHPVHMNAHNVQELITPRGGESVREVMQNNVDAVLAQRERTGQPMIIHLNHPNFGYAVTAEDLMHIVGEKFFEVYNGHPGVHNSGDELHASTERIWDIVLTKRLAELDLPVMYGLATDDGHSYHNIPSRASEPGRGWVMVLSDQLQPGSLIDALEAGRFYASSGVTLSRVDSSPKGLSLEVAAVEGETYTIEFIGTRKGYNPEGTPIKNPANPELPVTQKYDESIGALLKTVQGTAASYEFTGDEIYVRARVTSSAKHPNPSEVGEPQRAWVQPVVGPGTN
ncbi:MAG: hypothetical protein KDA58_02455 [Planctomycetaceae bacterium]|nr:hypothetical protein [Planctomycetaceae bacterium]